MFKPYHLLIIIAMLVMSACNTTDSSSVQPDFDLYTAFAQPELASGDPIPPPEGEVVLRIEGLISQSNVEGEQAVEFDYETLIALGVVEYTYEVHDYQATDERSIFRGVLLSDILAVVGMDESATTMIATANDDYQVDIPILDTELFPVIIATHQDDERITALNHGPLRIVYPYHNPIFWESGTEHRASTYDERWVWGIVSIRVE